MSHDNDDAYSCDNEMVQQVNWCTFRVKAR